MSKKWYNYFVSVEEGGPGGAPESAPQAGDDAGVQRGAAQTVADIAASISTVEPKFEKPLSAATTFDEIYQAAEIHPPAHGYTIYKVAEMLQNEHIRDLPPEIKRSSVLLALETAGVKLQEIVEDAVKRDKALDGFERVRRKAADDTEARKTEENQRIQAEMEKMLADFRARVQANNEAIAKERETFNAWLQQKQREEQKIADTIGYFVTANPITVGAVPPATSEKKPNSAH